MVTTMTQAIETLARTCAEAAWGQRTVDVDGTVLCSDEPLPGDWEALGDTVTGRTVPERSPTQDERILFEVEYSWHMSGLRDGTVTPTPAAPEHDFSDYFAQIERAEIQG